MRSYANSGGCLHRHEKSWKVHIFCMYYEATHINMASWYKKSWMTLKKNSERRNTNIPISGNELRSQTIIHRCFLLVVAKHKQVYNKHMIPCLLKILNINIKETQLKRKSIHIYIYNSNSLLLYPCFTHPHPPFFMVDPTPAGFLSMMYPTWRCKADISTFLRHKNAVIILLGRPISYTDFMYIYIYICTINKYK